MSINASVFVKDGNIEKALKILKKKLRKEGLWEYDPTKRHYLKGIKRKRAKEKST